MNFLTALHTDVGISKKTNQDSLCVKAAKTGMGNLLMAVVCDGMGGLAKGELASATVIRRFSEWFDTELPMMINGFSMEKIRDAFNQIIQEMNNKIGTYGAGMHVSLGTTLTVLFMTEKEYIIAHVGDSRAYRIDSEVSVLTEDQTVVGREVRRGTLTLQQAETDPRRSVLLQCIGASKTVTPDFLKGIVLKNTVYMLCSDGFRHVITPGELYSELNPSVLTDENVMAMKAERLVELNKVRRENDNISVIVIKAV